MLELLRFGQQLTRSAPDQWKQSAVFFLAENFPFKLVLTKTEEQES